MVRAIEWRARADSTPAMNSMKNVSIARVFPGRARTRPHASARAAERERAARFGYHESSSAISRIRLRVLSESPGRSFSAYETAPLETPARSAMSLIVTLRARLGPPAKVSPRSRSPADRPPPRWTSHARTSPIDPDLLCLNRLSKAIHQSWPLVQRALTDARGVAWR